jgi:hypothetical protein
MTLVASSPVVWEEVAIEEAAPTSDTKDGNDLAPNSPRLICKSWEASVERLERRLRSLQREGAGGRLSEDELYLALSRIPRLHDGQDDDEESKTQGNPRAVGSASAAELRLDIATERREGVGLGKNGDKQGTFI